MRSIYSFIKTALLLLCITGLGVACEDSNSVDVFDEDYGFVQARIYKKVDPISRAGTLDYLGDAYKIKLTFLYNNIEISDIAFFEYDNADMAEFGLRADRIKLLAGEYDFTSYTIYNELDDVLATVYMDEKIVVEPGKITVQDLYVDAVNRGKLVFEVTKDFSQFTRARDQYAFSEIRSADVTLQRISNGATIELKGMKTTSTETLSGNGYMVTDTVYSVVAGKYILKDFTLYSTVKGGVTDILETRTSFDKPVEITIEDNKTTEAEIPVLLNPAAEYIKDYKALKEIWKELNGCKWYYRGPTYAEGANWNFDKDIDEWGDQPGVYLHSNGRVAAMSIGGFGPYGKVPDDIGQLTELSELSFGASYDVYEGQTFPDRSAALGASLPILIPPATPGESIASHPIDRKWRGELAGSIREASIADLKSWRSAGREETELERVTRQLRGTAAEPQYTRSGYAYYGVQTNGITEISDKIGLLQKVTYLYISNTLIEELPSTLSDMVNLTDLELYNNVRLKDFPSQVNDLENLIILNVCENKQWTPDVIYNGLDSFFKSTAGAAVQGIHANNTRLQKVPASISNCSKLYLLDLSYCELEGEMTPFTLKVRIGQLYLDHNNITGFPQQFGDFRDCEDFSVTFNKLTKMPNIFNNEVVERVGVADFSYNQISEIEGEEDGSFRGIIATTLNLSNNRFTTFPLAFNNSKSEVSYFSFAFNEIEEVPEEALQGIWYGVESFNLCGNKLEKLPRSFHGGNLPYLYSVDLSWNRFSTMPVQPLNSFGLNIYIIQGQRDATGEKRILRSVLTSAINDHYALGYLDIRSNDVLTLGTSYPTNLNALLVRDNPNIIIEVPSTLCPYINSILAYDNTQNITGCAQLNTQAQKEL